MSSIKNTSVVLLSGGLDSAVNFYWAHKETNIKLALTFDYGQRAAKKEIERAQYLCEKLNVTHKVLNLPWFKDFTHSALVDKSQEVPVAQNVDINNYEISHKNAHAVWVPNRNGIFLNIAAAYAESLGADIVVPGFNSEEAQTFPDNTLDFIHATSAALHYSTHQKVQVKCFTYNLNKIEVAQKGKSLGVPFDKLWPCYLGGEKLCGECESCKRFQRALKSI